MELNTQEKVHKVEELLDKVRDVLSYDGGGGIDSPLLRSFDAGTKLVLDVLRAHTWRYLEYGELPTCVPGLRGPRMICTCTRKPTG
jgi:hypothetical protein